MQQFNPIDSALLFLESPRTPFHISMVMIYDPSTCPKGPPDFEDIVAAVEASLPVAKSFRRRILRVPLDLDHPYWVEDEHFDLEYHVRHLALPRPGNYAQFRNQVSRLISRPLDLTRPPWEMTVIEGLDGIDGVPPGAFAIVLKVHHCAIDGQSGVALISALHTDSPSKRPKKVKDDWKPEKVPTNRQLLRKAGLNSIRNPFQIAQHLFRNARALLRDAFPELRADEEQLEAPKTSLSVPISAHRVMDFAQCSLEDLKAVRRSVEGATLNDVCLAIVGGAMRSYLEAKGDAPRASLVTIVPVSTRTPEDTRQGGNQISLMRVSMHTDIADPMQRLAAIAADTRKKKAAQDGVMMSVLLKVVHKVPGALVGVAARAVSAAGARTAGISNTMVTNVPGPPVPIYFLGAKVMAMVGSPPLMDGGAVLHAVGSYNDRFMFTITACRDRIPDPEFYCKCLHRSAQEVIAAAKGSQAGEQSGKKKRAVAARPVKRPLTAKSRKRAVRKA